MAAEQHGLLQAGGVPHVQPAADDRGWRRVIAWRQPHGHIVGETGWAAARSGGWCAMAA